MLLLLLLLPAPSHPSLVIDQGSTKLPLLFTLTELLSGLPLDLDLSLLPLLVLTMANLLLGMSVLGAARRGGRRKGGWRKEVRRKEGRGKGGWNRRSEQDDLILQALERP